MPIPIVLILLATLQLSSAADPIAPLALKPEEIDWQGVPQTTDGRERALLVGRPEAGGIWTYRLRVRNPIRVEPHTHPVDEQITIIDGRWSLGIGRKFEADRLVTYPAGTFVVIPAGTPHFVQVDTPGTIIQSSGAGVFATHPIE